MSSSSSAQPISFISQSGTTSVYVIFLISGLIGNFCNIIVFGCFKLFRHNQCAFYLIIESISNFALLIIVLPLRIDQLIFAYDPTQSSLIWCKIRQAMVIILSLLSFSSVCYAAIDQYLSTNLHAQIRQLSTLKLSHRLIYITFVILILYSIPFMIFYEIQPGTGCTIINLAFSRFTSFVHFCVFDGILPITISTCFALLAYTNVRRIVRRQIPIMRRRLDRQLTAIVLAKVAFFVGTTLPFIVDRVYTLNVPDHGNNLLRVAVEQLIYTITTFIFYVNYTVCKLYSLVNFLIEFDFRLVSMYFLSCQSDFDNKLKLCL
jgi:hypothetical protein